MSFFEFPLHSITYCFVLLLKSFMEKHRNLSYQEQLLEDINRAEKDRFEVKKLYNFITLKNPMPFVFGRIQNVVLDMK